MAYVAPNTTVRLLVGCPLDNTYTHTIYFNSLSDQYTYFSGLTKSNCVFTQQSYQRVNRDKIRLQCKPDYVIDCNYMMFQNANHLNKWFYAFILETEYINENVVEITYELDVMQTWFFDYIRNMCLIERNHVAHDEIGSNIVPEPIEPGEYVVNSNAALFSNQLRVIIAISDPVDYGRTFDGVFSGCRLWIYEASDTVGIAAKINEYISNPDNIVSMYMIPAQAYNSDLTVPLPTSHGVQTYSTASSFEPEQGVIDTISVGTGIDMYVPHNKKLFTYPYNFLHLTDGNGKELVLRYEFFENNTPAFIIDTTYLQPVQVIVRPKKYKRLSYSYGTKLPSMSEYISIENYPLCSWSFDAYQAWIAQNAIPMAINAVGTVGGVMIGGAAGLTAAQIASAGAGAGVNLASNFMSQNYKASIAADICKGSSYGANANCAHGRQTIWASRMSVTVEMAKCIDSFFDLYGYAINKVQHPGIYNRKHYTYIKTNGCTIDGELPGSDIKKIESIYDKGITFWVNGNEVGDYLLASDNTPNA